MIKFHFYRRTKGIIPYLIQLVTKGYWNHVSIEVNGNVYEALGGRLLGTNGVVMSPYWYSYHQGKFEPTDHKVIAIKCDEANKIESYLKLLVGEKYDVNGVLDHIPFIRLFVKENKSRKYCSELGLKVYQLIKKEEYKLAYTPQSLFELIK